MLRLTAKGMRMVEAVHSSIERDSQFVQQLYRLPEEDRSCCRSDSALLGYDRTLSHLRGGRERNERGIERG